MAAEALSYLACTAGYLLLTLMLLWRWRGEWLGGLLVLACALTVAWSGTSAAAYLLAGGWTRLAMVSELLRDAGWIAFLVALLRQWRDGDGSALDRLMPLVYEELRRMAPEDRLLYEREHPKSEAEKLEELEREERDDFYQRGGEVAHEDLLDNHPPPDWGT